MDVNGNDNTPEWGWCKVEGCDQGAMPLWLSGEWPDDPDLLLCPEHIGKRIAELEAERNDLRAHFEAAKKRGDMFLGKIDAARDILQCEPDVSMVDCLQATLAELQARVSSNS